MLTRCDFEMRTDLGFETMMTILVRSLVVRLLNASCGFLLLVPAVAGAQCSGKPPQIFSHIGVDWPRGGQGPLCTLPFPASYQITSIDCGYFYPPSWHGCLFNQECGGVIRFYDFQNSVTTPKPGVSMRTICMSVSNPHRYAVGPGFEVNTVPP